MKPNKYIYWIALLMSVLMTSCASDAVKVEQLPSPTMAETAELIITLTPIPAPPTKLPTAEPTPTPHAGPACMPARDKAAFEGQDYSTLPDTILAYLNQGASRDALDNALYERGFASMPVPVVEGDMTGDGFNEIVVSVFDPDSNRYPPEGQLLIYVCRDQMYDLVYDEPGTADYPGAPHIWYWEDMDKDGMMDVVISNSACGAHTCLEAFKVLSWNGDRIVNRLAGRAEEFAYPDAQITDLDKDGFYELAIEDSGIASIGAGPQRTHTTYFSLDRAAGDWVQTGFEAGDSNYRIHVFHDSDDYLRAGDLDSAIEGYKQVIESDTLYDWNVPPEERAYLSAFARFRLITLYAAAGYYDLAVEQLKLLEGEFQDESPQYYYVVLGRAFFESFDTSGMRGGCEAVRLLALRYSKELLEPIGPGYFGYGNREYTVDDLCLWEGD